ncbi:NADPH-dependent ferric siderophore reductase [Pedobacter sp. CAN_A7]|uniref:FAD-binding oxidoreductase n=1 Tax=Pedobacter sp. CAN_A7 TaxID=2787722 RepID=UPI0018CBEFA9
MISTIPKWIGNLLEGALRPNARVLKISLLSPQVKKIRFQGVLSKMNYQIGYANVIRVSETEYRNYTVAHYDAKEGIADIVFHVHSNGVGSDFIDTLTIGDEIYISSARGRKVYDPNVKTQLIFGDETSLGLACSFYEVLKSNHHQFQFYFELHDKNKAVPELLGLENYTVFSKNGTFINEEWVHDLPIFKTADWQAANYILTGNVKSVQTFRSVLKNTTSGKVFSQGYWLEGKNGL